MVFTLFILSSVYRKPADKTVLNRHLLIHFWMRLVVILPHVYTFKCISFISQARPLNGFETFLSRTLLSHYLTRIGMIAYFTIYILISASRTLVFISPATFVSAKTTFWNLISIPILLVVLTSELILSGVLISPNKCQFDKVGFKLWDLAFTISDRNISRMSMEENNTTIFDETSQFPTASSTSAATMSESTPQVCHLFPMLMILLSTLIALETIRCLAAAVREATNKMLFA